MTDSINHDTILEEIHHTRERISEKFGGDIAAILADARERQDASGRPVWKRKSGNQPKDTLRASAPDDAD